MDQIPPETRRVQSLLTSLIIISILILGLVLAIAAYPTVIKPILAPATPPIPTTRPTVTGTLVPTPTPSPTITLTPRPTHTPTITPTPTESLVPSITPTPPGPPTLTPAQPVGNDAYKLGQWTEDLANLAIELMLDYPNTLISRLRGEDNRGYYDAFYYATIAGKEGLMRFQDSSHALQWRSDLAYSYAQMGDPQAGAVYADLLTQALNQDQVDLDGLADWFQKLEPRLQLNRIELKPPSPYLSSNILEVHGPGSAFIWLLESPTGYQNVLLDSNFDFINTPEMRLIISDLTGDGLEDAAIFNTAPTSTSLELPRIFDLAKPPVNELFFRPSETRLDPGMEYVNNWRIAKNESNSSDLVLELHLFPACPVTVDQTFHWNETYFDLAGSQYAVEPAPETLNTCRYVIEHAASMWGPQAAIQVMEQLLPDWPPSLDENGKPYPADARDQWLYRLGVYYAMLGDSEKAIQILQDLVQNPSVDASQWVKPAEDFLAVYKKPQDLYKACITTIYCDPNLAIDYLVNQLGIPQDQDPVQFLTDNGMILRSSGYFDFDDDGVKERWFTVQHHPLEKLELWALVATKENPHAIHISQIEGDKPILQFLNEDEKPPVVWVDSGTFVTFGRDKDTLTPYVSRVSPDLQFPNRFRDGLQQARQALFNGEDLKTVLDKLVKLQTNPGLLCQATYSCDEYFYLLGLTNELLGNERPAVEAYLQLWRDYSRSPFTTLARLKLARVNEPATLTPTPTLTLYPTTSLTPGTALPTATLGTPGTPSPTATRTITPTPGSYPPPGSTSYPFPIITATPYP
ncbi:MAG: hypothetical protein H6Q37_1615 [Chloroflexi bacterium]|nr:hypothetical protein [Chloroflexota bacterium]